MVEDYLTSAGSALVCGVKYEKAETEHGSSVFTILHEDMRQWLRVLEVNAPHVAPVSELVSQSEAVREARQEDLQQD